ncbi:bromodomain domain protein (macronuclear) [Tetrahymena thermophila SB210]|uniref:Bromodomain domain protein n=1 Tax=Tetrahymena thermophila (strain SB210) TaxID=312017 RepID=W7X7I9_TETTS|nr:bromodomain domain protein [Tetrahymena thermophila SB210]EWS72348.1 bromodomain domain protein [Tetrahymena thermophila SB210]|eukprot:XP_012655125.1 bromodomain domain protein [Tetrahymena thermophila SB210]
MDNLNSNQINTQNNTTVEFFLSSEQQRIINELLPKGYSLQFASKPARSKSGSFTKTIAQFGRQNDGQLRNSNGQFAPSSKASKKYGTGKLASQEGYAVPSLSYQGINQAAYPPMQGNGSNQNNNGMNTPQLNSQSSQIQGQYNQIPNLNQSQSQVNQQSGLNQQYSQNNNQLGYQQQQQIQQQAQMNQGVQMNNMQMQQQQMNQGGAMYGQNQNNDYYQMQQQNSSQYQTSDQIRMNQQMQQPDIYNQHLIHMKPTGQRKNTVSKPRKEKKLKQNEKAQKLNKRKSDASLAAKVSKKQRALMAAVGNEEISYGGMHPVEQKKCLHILHSLQKHKSSKPFLKPVDPIKEGCPDYYMVIREPMDLSTVEKNLKAHLYQSPTQFAADIHKIWKNSFIYNNRDSQIYNMTLEMEKYFSRKFKEIETNLYTKTDGRTSTTDIIQALTGFLTQNQKGTKKNKIAGLQPIQVPLTSAPQPTKKTKNPTSKMDIPMTMQEKKNLGQNILLLPPECLRGVWEIVQSDGNQQYDDKILTFDIDALSVRKTRELEQYVKQNMAANNKRLSKKQAKIQEKSMNADQKLIQNSTFGQDDETAATHHETVIVQDMTQSTIQHTQQYQVPMHPSQYQMEQMHTQTIGSYGNGQTEYAQHQHDMNQGMDEQGDINDIDSDSSNISDNDSDSQFN